MLNAFLVSRVSLSMWQAFQEFTAEGHSAVEIDDRSSAILQVILVVAFVSYFRLEEVNSKTLLESFFEVALVSAQWVLQFAFACKFTVLVE